jgi:hypothetical protein
MEMQNFASEAGLQLVSRSSFDQFIIKVLTFGQALSREVFPRLQGLE